MESNNTSIIRVTTLTLKYYVLFNIYKSKLNSKT